MTYLPPVARGEKILAFCLTEPDAGSDAGGVMTSAVPTDDGWVLNGRKRFVSGAPMADYALVFARTDPNAKGNRGISLFIVDMKDAGAKDASMRCSMSKYFAAEAANHIAYKAVQVFGGYGFIKGYKVERMYRDARITSIYEGTSQIQQVVISNTLLRD